jgi:hypothetical protein
MGRKAGGKNKKNRVVQESSFPSTAEESVAFSFTNEPEISTSLHDENEKKKKAFKEVEDIPEIFLPEQVAFVLDIYVTTLCFIFSMVLATDFKPLYEELKFEDDFKESLSKPLARICSKYAPHEWAGMQPEIELITSLGLWSVTAFSRAREVQKKEEKRKEEEKRKNNITNPVSPMPRQSVQAVG